MSIGIEREIEDRFRRWFVFGGTDEYVDISNGNEDVVTHVKRSEAERIIRDRDALIDEIVKLASLSK